MDDVLWIQILKDYNEACVKVETRVCRERSNYDVMDGNYLNPTIMGNIVPLDRKEGEYHYYKAIRDGLEILLVGGVIPKSHPIPRAPDYVIEANSQNKKSNPKPKQKFSLQTEVSKRNANNRH